MERSDREAMVEKQIRARGIADPRVLDAMREVPRHRFLPRHLRSRAYQDRPVSIGSGQTISQPYMVALMTEALQPQADQHVLEVGTGSGYQTAILARLTKRVDSVERIPELAAAARRVLSELGVTNVTVHVGDGSQGLETVGPFHGILVTAGSPEVPQPLMEQLRVGGRLVVPVGDASHQTLMTVVREPGGFRKHRGIGCVFVPLIGAHAWRDREAARESAYCKPEP